jgi:predicted secreted hydrolase
VISGLSRKGPDPDQSSYYYSIPHLQVGGELVLQGQRHTISAGSTAWLDHEWSQQMMPPQAVGWDWIGINLFDGSALTVFRLRDRVRQRGLGRRVFSHQGFTLCFSAW